MTEPSQRWQNSHREDESKIVSFSLLLCKYVVLASWGIGYFGEICCFFLMWIGYFGLAVLICLFLWYFFSGWMDGWLIIMIRIIVLVFFCGWIQVWVCLFRVKWNCGISLWMDALGGGKTDTAAATDAPVSQNFFCHTQKNTLLSIILDLPFWFFFISNLWHGRWMGNTWRVWKGLICPTRLTL